MRKSLMVLVVLVVILLIGWGLGERQPAWGQSPIFSPIQRVYVPAVMRDWDGVLPTPTPLPKLQGVGHDRKWEQDEADWLCPALELSGADWYYDWTPYPIQCEGIEAVPMIWDESQINIPVQGTSEYLQVFSEPDFVSQANMTPAEGAMYYRQVEQLYPDMKLVGPAVWYLSWLEGFWDEYILAYGTSPRMDAVSIHLYPQLVTYYAPASTHINISIAKMEAAIAFAEARGIPEVWVTEFAVQPISGGLQGSIDYMNGMVDWFQAQPMVTRWAWFGLDLTGFWYWPSNPELSAQYDTSLVLEGELTLLGEVYYNVVSP